MAPDDFHPDAHPEATEITGDRDYGQWGQCTFDEARSTGERCTQPAKGSHGKCRFHGGADGSGAPKGNDNAEGNDGGAPEDNTNAVTHGAYADHNSYYQNVLDDAMREFVDGVFEDYINEYRDLHGEPALGIKAELFRISVTHAKDIGLDRWANEKPEGLESGHPLVDEETEIVPIGDGATETQRSYRESVVLAAQKRLSTDRRQWLKDLDLLSDNSDGMDEGLAAKMWDDLTDYYED